MASYVTAPWLSITDGVWGTVCLGIVVIVSIIAPVAEAYRCFAKWDETGSPVFSIGQAFTGPNQFKWFFGANFP